MDDIRKNITLKHNTKELIEYCKDNPNFYKTLNLLEMYNNTMKDRYRFKFDLYYYENRMNIPVNIEDIDLKNPNNDYYTYFVNIYRNEELIGNIDGRFHSYEIEVLYSKIQNVYEFQTNLMDNILMGFFRLNNSSVNIFNILDLYEDLKTCVKNCKIIGGIN